jgi:hypothetical protein
MARASGLRSRGFVVFGGEQVADGQAPIRSPAFRWLEHLGVRWEMVEAIGALDGTPEREVAGQEHVGAIECDDQEPPRRPGPDPEYLGQGRFDLGVRHARQRGVAHVWNKTGVWSLRTQVHGLAMSGRNSMVKTSEAAVERSSASETTS